MPGQILQFHAARPKFSLARNQGCRPFRPAENPNLKARIFVVRLYMLIGTGFAGAVAGFLLLGFLYVPQLATISATFPAMFPTTVRFAGFAIALNISTSIFGGTAPMIGSGLISLTGDPLMPAY